MVFALQFDLIGYKTLLSNRQQVIHHTCTVYSQHDGQPLLRFIPGDAGYLNWATAKDHFLRQVLMATYTHYVFQDTDIEDGSPLREWENQQNDIADARMWAIRSTFPLPS